MIPLKDLSIIIPFQYDSQDRLEDLKYILYYLKKYFVDYEIILIESGDRQDDLPL